MTTANVVLREKSALICPVKKQEQEPYSKWNMSHGCIRLKLTDAAVTGKTGISSSFTVVHFQYFK